MKKIFSLIAVAGLLMACTAEEIETAFEVQPATATIEVTVYDVLLGRNVTNFSVAAEGATVSGTNVVLTGNKSISATTVDVTVTYNGESKTQAVAVSDVPAGGVATCYAIFVMGTPAGEYTYELQEKDSNTVTETGYVTSGDYSHSHNGIDYWYANESEFILTPVITYTRYSGSEVVSSTDATEGFENIFEGFKAAYNGGIIEVEDTYQPTISAWSWFYVYQTRDTKTTDYVLVATKDGVDQEVGSFTVKAIANGVISYKEIANPDGHGHYVYGHGSHDVHGYSENAGGGIIFAE